MKQKPRYEIPTEQALFTRRGADRLQVEMMLQQKKASKI